MLTTKIEGKTLKTNTLHGVGIFNKQQRRFNVTALLVEIQELKGITMEGSKLKIDISYPLENVKPGFEAILQEVINGHETEFTREDTRSGAKHDYIVVDLLKTRN